MPVADQLAGDRAADGAGSGDGDPHRPAHCASLPHVSLLGTTVEHGVRLGGVLLADDEVEHVALLEHRLAVREHALAEPVDPRDPRAGLVLQAHRAVPDPLLRDHQWSTRMVPEGSRKSGSAPAGRIRRSTWSAVHFTVATVVMPSRW